MIININDVFTVSDKVIPSIQNSFKLPNLHFNYYINSREKYLKGVCLDFGLYIVTYFEDIVSTTIKSAIFALKNELKYLAISHILYVIKTENFNILFENRVKNEGGWESFASDDNNRHIDLLKESIKKIKNNPISRSDQSILR